jgi:hypothetical protein
MYGPAAAEMKEFYDTLERHWMKDIVGKIVDTPVGLQPVFPTYFELWAKIYNPTEIGRVNKLFDLAEKKAAADPDALKRVKFMRRELWGPVLEGAEEFNRSANNRKLWTIHVPEAGKITVDGKLDEESWKKAETVWLLPAKDKPAEVQTRVRMLADRDFYYVGIECDEPFTDKMVCVKRKKDDVELWRDNVTEIFFSSGRQASFRYQIMLSSIGDICDLRAENRKEDLGWDSGMEYRHSVVPGKRWAAASSNSPFRKGWERNRRLISASISPKRRKAKSGSTMSKSFRGESRSMRKRRGLERHHILRQMISDPQTEYRSTGTVRIRGIFTSILPDEKTHQGEPECPIA